MAEKNAKKKGAKTASAKSVKNANKEVKVADKKTKSSDCKIAQKKVANNNAKNVDNNTNLDRKMFKEFKKDIHIGNSVITLETGYMANQADGSVLAKCGGTSVLCVVCSAKEDSPDVDFFPLTVNYIEKAYACGKIPGGFYKREAKQSEREILISRLIDRPIRPIFVDGYYRNTQIICTLLSYDGKTEPDMVALVGASTAVALAGLPTQGIVSGCRVGYIDNKYVINPTKEQLKNSKLDLVVAGTTNAVLMVESEAQILTEEEMLGAIACGQEAINQSVEEIKQFVKEVGKEPSVEFYPRDREALYQRIKEMCGQCVIDAFKIQDKLKRHKILDEIYKSVKEELKIEQEMCCCDCDDCCDDDCCCDNKCCSTLDKHGATCDKECCCDEKKCSNAECNCCDDDCGCCYNGFEPLVFQNGEPVEMNDVDIKLMYARLQEEVVRGQILRDKIRIDGRKLDQVRPIDVRVGVLPQVHGSAVFSRGMTQVMAIGTLGTSQDEQQSDSLTDSASTQRFMLHYNFPGYSAGEAIAPKAPGRRELGHGNLARRALNPVIPSKEEYPYSIRVVGEVLSSDGSTSQATVCSSCLALMDMGVPLKAPVAGVAMGLIKEGNKYEVLTDIMADEDHLGDMDFKVAGPLEGITALQMDIKTFGITIEIMRNALAQAKKAREHIMSKMLAVLPAPRENGLNTPKSLNLIIDEKKIPDVIGKSGSNIKKICETSGAKIDIVDNKVNILASNQEQLFIAKEMVEASIGHIEFGRIFDAEVKSLLSFGAIVDIGFDRTGLVHISELSNEGLEPSMVLKEGQKIKVKFVGCDEKGRFKFSYKQVDQQTGKDIGDNQAPQVNNQRRFNKDNNRDNRYNKKDFHGYRNDRADNRNNKKGRYFDRKDNKKQKKGLLSKLFGKKAK